MERSPSEKFHGAINFTCTVFGLAIANLPSDEDLESGFVRQHGYEFQTTDQTKNFEIELCWAFLTRLDGIFEALCKRLNIEGKRLKEKIRDSADLSSNEKATYRKVRLLRNLFHHGDGTWALLDRPGNLAPEAYLDEPTIFLDDVLAYAEIYRKLASVVLGR